ncbi:MAG: hypothetical protein WDO71_09430 [Bacteroidota bacterium]
MEKIMGLGGEVNPFMVTFCAISVRMAYNSISRLAAPKSKKNIISTIDRPWGNSSEETSLTARMRL